VEFIHANRDRAQGGLRWGVEPICRVLTEHGVKIAPSTHYEWASKTDSARAARDAELTGKIRDAYQASHQIYGARKIWVVLNRAGVQVARRTVERLTRAAGLKGVTRCRRKRTTVADPALPTPGDLVNRMFDPPAPDRLWVADITYVSTWSGWVYVAFVQDCFSRRVLGWKAAASMTTDLVLAAIGQALDARAREHHPVRPGRLVGHSDHGSQHMSVRYGEHLSRAGIARSAGTVGDSYDNAVAETLNGVYKAELVWHAGPWRAAAHLEYETGCYLHWYNNQRIHEYDAYLSPVEYENHYYERMAPATPEPDTN